MWAALALLLVTITVDAGLLRVPKIYNTVITSDANLEPSRAYPIVQPVLTVQPVVAVEDNRQPYYPVPLHQGLYPFLSGTNTLYQQQQQQQQQPLLYGRPPAVQVQQPLPLQQQQIPAMPLGDMLNHHNKNPAIPDVPPPPLPVSAAKKT